MNGEEAEPLEERALPGQTDLVSGNRLPFLAAPSWQVTLSKPWAPHLSKRYNLL